MVDKTGQQHSTENVTGFPKMKLATLDIDRTFVHWDNNRDKMEQLLADSEYLVDNTLLRSAACRPMPC